MEISIYLGSIAIALGIYLGLVEIARAIRGDKRINVTLPPIVLKSDDSSN